MRGGAKVAIEAHRHAGVFIARGKEDALVTKNLVPGDGSITIYFAHQYAHQYDCLASHGSQVLAAQA